jgi:hypothetical protein
MAEQSHRDEMNAAIRAQRERHAAPRTIAPSVDEPDPAGPEAQGPASELSRGPARELPPQAKPPRKSMLDRLRGR